MDVGDFKIAHKVVIYRKTTFAQIRIKYYDNPSDANAAQAYLEARLHQLQLPEYGVYWEEVIVEKQFDKEKLEDLLAWVD